MRRFKAAPLDGIGLYRALVSRSTPNEEALPERATAGDATPQTLVAKLVRVGGQHPKWEIHRVECDWLAGTLHLCKLLRVVWVCG